MFPGKLALLAAAVLAGGAFAGCSGSRAAETDASAPAQVARAVSSPPGSVGPADEALVAAMHDPSNWLLAGHDYTNNRYVASTFTRANIAKLGPAWSTQIADDGEQEAAPIVWHGTMYLSTPHNHVIALDARSGKLKWDAPYTPASVLDFAVNRGVGIADGKIFIATQDCRVRALDAQTGKQIWNVAGCSTKNNNWYSMPTYAYKQMVLVGISGGDFGGNGSVQAFRAGDGTKLWQWNTIPAAGQPGHQTWPGDSWRHGGAALWGAFPLMRAPTHSISRPAIQVRTFRRRRARAKTSIAIPWSRSISRAGARG